MSLKGTYAIIVFVFIATALPHQSLLVGSVPAAHPYVLYAPSLTGFSPEVPGNGSVFSPGISIGNVSTRPALGTVRLAIILARFSDIPATRTPAEIQQDYFGTNNSVAAYYHEVSYGKLTLTGDVFGWYILPYPESHYGRDCNAIDDADCSGSDQSWQIAQDASTLARHDVTFANYDYFVFVHSGNGEESSGVKDDVWSVTYLGGVWVNPCLDVQEDCNQRTLEKFNITPELEANDSVPLGVYCHEFGHQLGLPDMYDTHTGKSRMGDWELMDKGLWNGKPMGSEPAEMSSWSRERLGWLPPDDIATVALGSDELTDIKPLELTPLNGSISAVIVPLTNGEYYLFENREPIGNDLYLPDHGIVGYHINENVDFFTTMGSPAAVAAFHPGDLVSTTQIRARVMAASNSSLFLGFGSTTNETIQQSSSLTVSVVPSAPIAVVIGNQTYTTDPATGNVTVIAQFSNETFEVIVPETVDVQPGVRLQFSSWENGNTNSSRFILLTSNLTLTATYTRQYFVSVLSQYGASSGSGWFDENAQDKASVDQIIDGATGTRYVFAGWTGNISAVTDPVSFKVTAPMNLTAMWTTFNSMQLTFYDMNSSDLTPTLIDSMTLRAPNGTLLVLSSLQPTSSFWFEKGDYDVLTVYVYGVDTIAGTEHFTTSPEGVAKIQLQLYTMTFRVNDYIFGSPLDGGTVTITLPNGQTESAALTNGRALFRYLPAALYPYNMSRAWSLGDSGETALPNQPNISVGLIVIPSLISILLGSALVVAAATLILKRHGGGRKRTRQVQTRRDRSYSDYWNQ
jgi:M6 family metalloprotease-like protein